jgi:Gnt-I system low-affinity gluconate transporter
MIEYQLLGAVVAGISLLLVLILAVRLQAFVALLISSIAVGILAGMEPLSIMRSMQQGMGDTLGFVAVVVGLGAMFGAILEHSGGAESIARYLMRKFGEKRASWAMVLTGFVVAIPVFFDVAFIILVPLIYALQRRSGKSLLRYGLPLLAGLAITHAFIPPTPGPVAVADILQADLGWVILFGIIVGIPTAIVCGPFFSNLVSRKIHLTAPEVENGQKENDALPGVGAITAIIGLPIFLILCNTVLNSPAFGDADSVAAVKKWIALAGHPFTALILANLIAWYVLGIRKGTSREQLARITARSMEPAGIIILLTGAGGVFKQVLIDTGAGEMAAASIAGSGLGVFVFSFIAAVIVRVLQGSATVAMITAAGLTAPLLTSGMPEMAKALLVIAIASGASALSHVNDSGFWLVSKYLGMSEKQTFSSWTAMTTLLAVAGFVCAGICYLLIT